VEIQELLPHREPFLFVDEIIELIPREYSKVLKHVREDEFWVKGHFPEGAVFPGALMMETMAQGGGIMLSTGGGHNKNEHNAYLSRVDNLKFICKVIPGDTVIVEGKFVEKIADFIKVKVKASVHGKKVAEAMITYIVLQKI
jgi:3-hydroxyacyl-[acyl-carrier-protein] dehydratase